MIFAVFTMWTIYASYRVIKYVDYHEEAVKQVNIQLDKQKLVADSILRSIDSVNNKLMVVTIDKQRYEVAINRFKEEDSIAALKLERIINESE